MGGSSLQCTYEGCNRKGAYHFNRLCNYHWDMKIEQNLKEIIKNERSVKY